MPITADRPEASTAIRTDLGAIFVSLELSRSTWLITSLPPGGRAKMSKHSVRGGDLAALFGRFKLLQKKAQARAGKLFPVVVIQEAGLDGFWIHRALEANGIESHVVDPASIATSRRRRRAKTDKIDGEALVRTLLAYKRGEPRVCAMVTAPSPEDEDRRRICRERKVLVAERVEHVNRIKGLLFAQGVGGYEPLRRDRRKRLEDLRTGDGRPLPALLKAQISRELDRFEMLLEQIKTVEAERDALIAADKETTSPQRQRRCCSTSGVLALNLPPSSGRRDCSGTSITGDRLQLTQVWLLRPGKADLSIGNKGSRKPGTQDYGQHLFSWLGYGCVISRSRRSPCGSRNASSRVAACERRQSSRWRESC